MPAETLPTAGSRAAPEYPITLPLAAITCALAPAYVVRWHIGGYPTTLLEASIVLTVVAFTIETRRQRASLRWNTPFTVPALLLLLAATIGVLVPSDHRAALGLWRAYFVEPMAFFLVLSQVMTSARRALFVLAGLAIGVLAIGVPNMLVTIRAAQDHSLNVGGTPPVVIYPSANQVALFEVPVIAVAGAVLLYSRQLLERALSGAFLLVAFPAFLLTFSRGGYLALLVVGIALAWMHPRRWWLLGGVGLLALGSAAVPAVRSRISHILTISDPSNSIPPRLRLWGDTLRMLADHPIFGSGIAAFQTAIRPYANRPEEIQGYPHNIVLNFWTFTGLLGLAAFIWLITRAVRLSWSGWRRAPESWRPLHLGILLSLVAIVLHGLVDVPYFKNDLSIEFWVLLAVIWAGTRWPGRQSGDAPTASDAE